MSFSEAKDCLWKKEEGEGENDENKVPNCFQQHKKNERGRNESRSGWSSALNKFLQTSPVYGKTFVKLWPELEEVCKLLKNRHFPRAE